MTVLTRAEFYKLTYKFENDLKNINYTQNGIDVEIECYIQLMTDVWADKGLTYRFEDDLDFQFADYTIVFLTKDNEFVLKHSMEVTDEEVAGFVSTELNFTVFNKSFGYNDYLSLVTKF